MNLSDIFSPASTEHGTELFSAEATAAIQALLLTKNGKVYIQCQIRKTDLLAKPEEVVRQFWLFRLMQHYKYPASRITVEYPITFGRDTSKRADIIVFDKDRTTVPYISYIPMARGFVYLAAVVDWFSRRVLSWKLSITMDVSFCLEAVEEALSMNEKPVIFNTDQGSQFSSDAFTEQLRKNEIAISMDGKGCWRDNVFVERIWRTIKYEEVYLRAYDSVHVARTSLGRYLEFYNETRPHSSLKGRTPDQVYFNPLPLPMAA